MCVHGLILIHAAHVSRTCQQIDWQSIRQAHAFISAGACLSLGLRFASTGDKGAAEAITGVIRYAPGVYIISPAFYHVGPPPPNLFRPHKALPASSRLLPRRRRGKRQCGRPGPAAGAPHPRDVPGDGPHAFLMVLQLCVSVFV